MVKLNCVLLIDDDEADNLFHKKVIEGMGIANNIVEVKGAVEALDYFRNENNVKPELVFLDINMPKMDGWEFISEYHKMYKLNDAIPVFVILTTSSNHEDIERADKSPFISEFETKPLTEESIANIMDTFF